MRTLTALAVSAAILLGSSPAAASVRSDAAADESQIDKQAIGGNAEGDSVDVLTDIKQGVDGSTVLGVSAARPVVHGEDNGTVSGTGNPPWARLCTWQSHAYADIAGALETYTYWTSRTITEHTGPDDQWGTVACPAPTGPGVIDHNPFTLAWPLAEPPPAPFINWLIQRAQETLQLPLPAGQAAPQGTPDIPFITQLPTWLWIHDTHWQPVTATTPAVFGYSVTATATPTNVTFTGENGEQVNCGPNTGPPYNFNLKEHQQHSDCVLTYKNSSSITDHTLQTHITWHTTWRCQPTCGQGQLPPLTITTTRPVIVAEIQAIITS